MPLMRLPTTGVLVGTLLLAGCAATSTAPTEQTSGEAQPGSPAEAPSGSAADASTEPTQPARQASDTAAATTPPAAAFLMGLDTPRVQGEWFNPVAGRLVAANTRAYVYVLCADGATCATTTVEERNADGSYRTLARKKAPKWQMARVQTGPPGTTTTLRVTVETPSGEQTLEREWTSAKTPSVRVAVGDTPVGSKGAYSFPVVTVPKGKQRDVTVTFTGVPEGTPVGFQPVCYEPQLEICPQPASAQTDKSGAASMTLNAPVQAAPDSVGYSVDVTVEETGRKTGLTATFGVSLP